MMTRKKGQLSSKKTPYKKKSVLSGDLQKEGIVSQKDEFLESEEHDETHQERKLKIRTGQLTADVYTEEGREELGDEAEIKPWEEGFAEGAERGAYGECENCGVLLGDRGDIIEKEVDNDLHWFCSERCARKYKTHTDEE